MPTCSNMTPTTVTSPRDRGKERHLHHQREQDQKLLFRILPAPWDDEGVDVVIESTGLFLDREGLTHLYSGAKKVITAPAKERTSPWSWGEPQGLQPQKARHRLERVLYHELPGPARARDPQGIRDREGMDDHGPPTRTTEDPRCPGDLRRARAAALNIIPTSTGAAKALSLVILTSRASSTATP